RTLLDVQLDVSVEAIGSATGAERLHGVETVGGHRLDEADVVEVAGLLNVAGAEHPGDRLAAEQAAESPLLVGERDALERLVELALELAQPAKALEPDQDPKRAVERPAA